MESKKQEWYKTNTPLVEKFIELAGTSELRGIELHWPVHFMWADVCSRVPEEQWTREKVWELVQMTLEYAPRIEVSMTEEEFEPTERDSMPNVSGVRVYGIDIVADVPPGSSEEEDYDSLIVRLSLSYKAGDYAGAVGRIVAALGDKASSLEFTKIEIEG